MGDDTTIKVHGNNGRYEISDAHKNIVSFDAKSVNPTAFIANKDFIAGLASKDFSNLVQESNLAVTCDGQEQVVKKSLIAQALKTFGDMHRAIVNAVPWRTSVVAKPGESKNKPSVDYKKADQVIEKAISEMQQSGLEPLLTNLEKSVGAFRGMEIQGAKIETLPGSNPSVARMAVTSVDATVSFEKEKLLVGFCAAAQKAGFISPK